MADRGNAGPIPQRWLYCPRISESLVCEKFLAFKTPLSEKFDSQMPPECIFTPDILFSYTKTLKLKLGMWIDLTNTKRFYDSEKVKEKNTKYIKLQCQGHSATPSEEQTRAFINIVDEFLNDRPLDIIGVHCTHGFNRTGFLIISYMVERLDCSVEAALRAFASARPPGIYKGDYIRELYRRYDDVDDAPEPPVKPEWCFEVDTSQEANAQGGRKRSHGDDDDDDDVEEDLVSCDGEIAGQSKGRKKQRKEKVLKDATFMPGISGVHLFLEQPKLGELQVKVQEMCTWEKCGFPGSQPVSMDQKNIKKLHLKPYRVSWKADGTRYMMLIKDRNEIYFFDRNFSCFQVDHISFPKKNNLKEHLKDTLLDGEMVIDHFQGKQTPRYLIYDIISFDGDDMMGKAFYKERLDCIEELIVKVRHEAIVQGIVNRALEPFGIRAKGFWDIQQSKSLLADKFAKSLLHKPDGLIFQPSIDPYTPGQSPDVLKWKPLNMNSIDFKLKIVKESGLGIVEKKIAVLLVGKDEQLFGKMKLTKDIKDLDNKIIECTLKENQWVFLRERTDKTFPNSFETAKAVLESIKHPVTTEQLLTFIDLYRFRDDTEIMPPPRQNPHLYHLET